MEPALIVSPHLDDAVLSVGQVMAGRPNMAVCTVFAGIPQNSGQQTSYDRDSGFHTATRAVIRRRAEDKGALHILHSRPIWLNFADDQYGEPADETAIVEALRKAVDQVRPTLLLGPLGLAHPDHHATRRAYQQLVSSCDIEAWIYEDLPSRVLWPEEVPEALAWWKSMGHRLELGFVGTGPLDRKQKALARYTSQLWALKGLNEHAYLVPERVWRLWPSD